MEDNKNSHTVLGKISNILSAVFSPLLIPTYAYAIALWTTPLSYIPEKIRFTSCIVIFIITTVIPLGTIIFLIRRGKVADAAISNPKERFIPYTITILCYLIAAFYLWRMPDWLKMFFVGAAFAAIIDALVNVRWKISAHTTSMGGLCALILFIGFNHLSTVLILPWLANALLFSGAVGSARIYLGRHTPAQVYVGWLVGFVVSYVAMMI